MVAAVKPNPPIPQTGAYGYLLWLRRDLPAVYRQLCAQYPAVAAFEAAARRESAGLGDDAPISVDVAPVTVDYSAQLSMPSFDSTPLPSFTPTDFGGAAASSSSWFDSDTLASIGKTVAAVLPSVIAGGAIIGAAVINSNTAKKAQTTAQLQLQRAMVNAPPYQTGVISPAIGGNYLAPIQYASGVASSSDSGLYAQFYGLPLYIWLVGALGVMVVLSLKD